MKESVGEEAANAMVAVARGIVGCACCRRISPAVDDGSVPRPIASALITSVEWTSRGTLASGRGSLPQGS